MAQTIVVSRGNSMFVIRGLPLNSCYRSIIEGTRESLERLGLDYVDIIFAHRPDVSGKDNCCHLKRWVTMTFVNSPHGRNRSGIQLGN